MTARFVAVLPVIVQEMGDACLDTICPTLRQRTLVVDNTTDNIGVPASWNRGAEYAHEQDADWLIIVSAAVRFGPMGGLDLIAQLSRSCHKHEAAVEAGDGMGWHLIAVNMAAFDKVGPFDERFSPAYFEESDWSTRAHILHGWDPAGPWWPKVPVDATLTAVAHGMKSGKVQIDYGAQKAKYVAKWGGEPGHEKWKATGYHCPRCRDLYEHCACEER